jgi:hypothetical protein
MYFVILKLGGAMQFSRGQNIWIMNLGATRQKVAAGAISGIGGEDQFHFNVIPDTWYKIDIKDILAPAVPLV